MELQSAVKLEYRVLRINKSLCCGHWPLASWPLASWPAGHWECVVIAKNELFNLALLYGQKHPFLAFSGTLKNHFWCSKQFETSNFEINEQKLVNGWHDA